MKKIVKSMLIISALGVALPVLANNHLKVINTTSSNISVSCGHDGQAGRAHDISHDHSRGMDIHGHGEIRCTARNGHGDYVASRTFHYSDHGNDSKTWEVRRSSH